MKYSEKIKCSAAALGMLLLILDSKVALDGALEGMELCLRVVIPALFPFFVLSALIADAAASQRANWLRPLGRLTGIPIGSEAILLTGYLGGYPIGAKAISQAYHQGRLSREDAARMLAICNNPGPAFIFGIAGSLFPGKGAGFIVWLIVILSSLTAAAIAPGKSREIYRQTKGKPVTLTSAVSQSLAAMAGVCGWVILMRIGIVFLRRWFLWRFPDEVSVVITGILELANGCTELHKLPDTALRLVICVGMLTFGGLCVTMQTASVADGIDMSRYIPGKLLQTAIAMVLALMVVKRSFVSIILLTAVLLTICVEKGKNRGRISRLHGV